VRAAAASSVLTAALCSVLAFSMMNLNLSTLSINYRTTRVYMSVYACLYIIIRIKSMSDCDGSACLCAVLFGLQV
jgi:hypothetical protein